MDSLKPPTPGPSIRKEPAYILLSSKGHITAADSDYTVDKIPFPPNSLLFSPLYIGKDPRSTDKSSVLKPSSLPNVTDALYYNEVSHVFNESEYKEIVAYYNICGLNAWKIVAELPKFQERGTHVLDLCERLEDYKMGQWTQNVDQLKALVDEIKDWTTSTSQPSEMAQTSKPPGVGEDSDSSPGFLTRRPLVDQKQPKEHSTEDSKNLKKKQSSFVINEEYEAMLTHFETMKPGQRSPTSSSSGYGSASSVRSRSSWSTDPNEFPFAFPTGPKGYKMNHNVSPVPSSPHSSSPISSRFIDAPATGSSTRPRGEIPQVERTADPRPPLASSNRYPPLTSSNRYRLWPSSKGKKKPSNKS